MKDNIGAVILAAGFGNRLSGVVSNKPKPMALINEKPFLEHLIVYFKKQGVKNFIICVSHLAGIIESYFKDGKRWDININYSKEKHPSGTAGALIKAKSLIESQRFLCLNGDTFLEFNLANLYDYHQKNKALATICLTKFKDIFEKGEVIADKRGKVLEFKEKQAKHRNGWINGGAYLFEKQFFNFFPKVEKKELIKGFEYSLEHHVFPKIIRDELPLYAFPTKGYFIDIGTPGEYKKAQKYFK